MPIYEYVCQECGKFEKMQKISDPFLQECPKCASPVEKIISKDFGIQFKGTGFYKTDNSEKDRARRLNQERQRDNECILDGDVSRYADQAEATTKSIAENQ